MIGQRAVDVDCSLDLGRTALHEACWMKRADVARMLIDCGARVNMRDENGVTPLHEACHNFGSGKSCQIVTELLHRGADPRAVDFAGWTPMHYLACGKRGGCYMDVAICISALVLAGADAFAESHSGETPLEVQSRSNSGDFAGAFSHVMKNAATPAPSATIQT